MFDRLIRQGDILLKRIPGGAVPAGARPVRSEDGRLILAHGETTGHHHSVALSNRVALFREDGVGGGMFMTVTAEPTSLDHNSNPVEHTSHELAPGLWEVEQQRVMSTALSQYSPD